MLTESDILKALRDCYDPVLACNIVDLGLIHAVTITRDLDAPGTNIPGGPQKHIIEMAPAPPQTDESSQAQLLAQNTHRLAGLETVSRTTITVLETPVWTP